MHDRNRDVGAVGDPGQRWAELGCRCADPEPGWTGPGTAAWSPDLGFAGADLDPAVVTIARSAARRWVSRTGLDEIEVPVRLRDPAPAWAALRRPGASAASLRAANALRRANDRALRELFERVDLLLTPATPDGPHGHDGPGGRMNVALTWAFNLSGHPAVSVPAGFGPDGCPVGLQIVARPGEDHRLLTLLERHQPVTGVAVPR
ncbi:amidase family protein [Pseudonocardia parietis]